MSGRCFGRRLALVVGLQRLAPLGRVRRPLSVGAAIIFWAGLIGLLAVVGRALALDRSAIPVPGPNLSNMCSIFLLIIQAEALRRTYGLLKSRLSPPAYERRHKSTPMRLMQAALMALLAFVHVHLALVFGVIGPNPAARLRQVTVVHRMLSSDDSAVVARRELLLIERHGQFLLGFDADDNVLIQIPTDRILEITHTRFSPRQKALLERLEAAGQLDAAAVAECFPIREAIRRREIADLCDQGLVARAPDGGLRPGPALST